MLDHAMSYYKVKKRSFFNLSYQSFAMSSQKLHNLCLFINTCTSISFIWSNLPVTRHLYLCVISHGAAITVSPYPHVNHSSPDDGSMIYRL